MLRFFVNRAPAFVNWHQLVSYLLLPRVSNSRQAIVFGRLVYIAMFVTVLLHNDVC